MARRKFFGKHGAILCREQGYAILQIKTILAPIMLTSSDVNACRLQLPSLSFLLDSVGQLSIAPCNSRKPSVIVPAPKIKRTL
jgi:hypothetical protein